MTLAQREHPEAVAEFDAAVRWYEEQEPGIGLALIDRARQARKDLDQWPNAAPPFTTADDGTVIPSKAVRGYATTAYRAQGVTTDTAHVIATARLVLYGVIHHIGTELSAHEAITAEQERWSNIGQLAAEYETIAQAAQHDRWASLLTTAGLTGEVRITPPDLMGDRRDRTLRGTQHPGHLFGTQPRQIRDR